MYNQLNKAQASTLVQLRTGKSRLNDDLSAIGAVETDQCSCGTARETISHFLFHCAQWRDHRQKIREKAAGGIENADNSTHVTQEHMNDMLGNGTALLGSHSGLFSACQLLVQNRIVIGVENEQVVNAIVWGK